MQAAFFGRKLTNVINAESYHLIGLFKVISDTEMCTTRATAKNKIVIMCKNDQNHSRQLLKPAHLAHKLKSAQYQQMALAQLQLIQNSLQYQTSL